MQVQGDSQSRCLWNLGKISSHFKKNRQDDESKPAEAFKENQKRIDDAVTAVRIYKNHGL